MIDGRELRRFEKLLRSSLHILTMFFSRAGVTMMPME